MSKYKVMKISNEKSIADASLSVIAAVKFDSSPLFLVMTIEMLSKVNPTSIHSESPNGFCLCEVKIEE